MPEEDGYGLIARFGRWTLTDNLRFRSCYDCREEDRRRALDSG
jgi:hypothetical protein